MGGDKCSRRNDESQAPGFDSQAITPETVNHGLDYFQVSYDFLRVIHGFVDQ